METIRIKRMGSFSQFLQLQFLVKFSIFLSSTILNSDLIISDNDDNNGYSGDDYSDKDEPYHIMVLILLHFT